MPAGIICICIGIIDLLINFQPFKIKNAVYVKGEVCAREYHNEASDEHHLYYITVRYFVNGIEYYSRTNFRQLYIKDGKKMLVKYNKYNPKECIIIPKGAVVGSLIWIVFGIYAILATLGLVYSIFG